MMGDLVEFVGLVDVVAGALAGPFCAVAEEVPPEVVAAAAVSVLKVA